MSSPVERVLAALREHDHEPRQQSGGGWMCQCPAHDDRNPSLSINAGSDGRALLHCHAGCSTADVVGALGLTMVDLMPDDDKRFRPFSNRETLRPTPNGEHSPSSKDWSARVKRYADALDGSDDDLRSRLARDLSVSPASLRALGIGWTGKGYTFPERDGDGAIIGIGTRAPDGAKRTMRGGHRGLTVPDGLADMLDPVLVVEGPSDTAACLTLGLTAVGRPQCTGGATHLATMLEGRDTLVVGERDAKSDGRWPGRDGAKRVAGRLASEWDAPVSWTLPPEETKDVRAWLTARVADGLDLSDADACKAAGVELLQELLNAAIEVEPKPTDERSKGEKRSQADRIVALVMPGIDLWHTPGGDDSEAYATVAVGNHRENMAINAKGFRRWIARRFHEHTGRASNSQALQDALNVLAGRAIFDGAEHDAPVRLAEHDGVIWLDLCDPDWRVVRIDATGWRVVASDECPVRFIRKRGALALPTPESGGTVDKLREIVNLPDDDQWTLYISWLVAAMRPRGPYPVLVVNGVQGSAKSTLCRIARRLIDPNMAALRRPPRDERDLMIAAMNGWLVAYENLSGIRPDLSDALCALATGGGFATRELYSDGEEKLFDAMRPIMLNGIDDLATRPDLLDRAVVLTLPPIPDEARITEAELWASFESVLPQVLGALLDAVAGALAALPSVKLDRYPRMADFARWATAAESALGWGRGRFMRAYSCNRADTVAWTIETSAIGLAVQGLVNSRSRGRWEGTAGELLTALNDNHSTEADRKRRDWPRTAAALSKALRRLEPDLRAAGIRVEHDRESSQAHRRIITIDWVRTEPSEPSEPSDASPKQPSQPREGRFAPDRKSDRTDRSVSSSCPAQNPPGASAKADSDGSDTSDGAAHTQSGDVSAAARAPEPASDDEGWGGGI